ncbi:unnamed protein product, partial [Ectocarpus fasciculatus]
MTAAAAGAREAARQGPGLHPSLWPASALASHPPREPEGRRAKTPTRAATRNWRVIDTSWSKRTAFLRVGSFNESFRQNGVLTCAMRREALHWCCCSCTKVQRRMRILAPSVCFKGENDCSCPPPTPHM